MPRGTGSTKQESGHFAWSVSEKGVSQIAEMIFQTHARMVKWFSLCESTGNPR